LNKRIILTGDRPTGPLHLGHFVGSLKNRVKLQHENTQYIMIADAQALTDHADRPQIVRQNVESVLLDYLSVGIDPDISTIFIQSKVPEVFELTSYFLNLVTINRLKHNPTVKAEIKQKHIEEATPAGFVVYPVSQAADITAFKANLVPVGEDQLPMIEQTTELVRKFNRTYKCKVLVEPEAMVPKIARLPGTDGGAKMGKTLNNAIYLSDPLNVLEKKVKKMYTDPGHLRIEDPGKVEGNPVFTYLDVFGTDLEKIAELKAHYQKGGLADSIVKKYLLEVLVAFLEPVWKKRKEVEASILPMELLKKGTEKARERASLTLKEVKEAMHLNYF
jgi:tryptophanyl-tRNA synthetase